MWWKEFQFQFSNFVNFFRKWGILILCHNLPIKKCLCILTKKMLAGWWTTCSNLCTSLHWRVKTQDLAAFNSLHGFIACHSKQNKVWVKSIKSYCNNLSPKGGKLLATKSDHKRPQFLFSPIEMDFHTLTMMLLFDGF
jgi:hypothetical protein